MGLETRTSTTPSSQTQPDKRLRERITERVTELGSEQIGNFFGNTLMRLVLKDIRRMTSKFDVMSWGEENFRGLEGKPFILASNHVKPKVNLYNTVPIGSDYFVLEEIVRRNTGQQTTTIGQYDDLHWSENPGPRWRQEHIHNPMRRATYDKMGFVPLNKNPETFKKRFLRAVEAVIAAGKPLIVFPGDTWYEDFSPEQPMQNGTAHLAIKHNLPIVPAYITGCYTWKTGQKVYVRFGERIDPTGKDKATIMEEIKAAITQLQSQTKTAMEQPSPQQPPTEPPTTPQP